MRAKAKALGLRTQTEADLVQALLGGGVSTKMAPTDISGRGAGVSACAHACEALGGQMSLESQRGKGATFRFRFPADRWRLPSGAANQRRPRSDALDTDQLEHRSSRDRGCLQAA